MTKPTVSLRGMLAGGLLALASPHLCAQLDVGLVAYWPLDGNLLDDTATGAHGTLVPGSGDPTERYANAKFGQGIDLNNFQAGSYDQWINITGAPEATFDFAGGSMTVSAWVSSPFLSLDSQAIIAKGLSSANTWSMARDGTNLSVAFHGGLGANGAADDPNADLFFDLEMHHLVGVVRAGAGVDLYVDGQLVGTASGAATLADSTFNLAIGANPAADTEFYRAWEGIIDDVAVWNRALGSGEIATIYNNGAGVSIGEALNPVDTDGDGMPDFYEISNGLDPNVNDANGDLDGDGLNNLREYQDGTSPQLADTDGDGLDDGDEVNRGTSPTASDSDGDRLSDGEEVLGTRNPYLGGTLRDPFDPLSDPPGDPTDPLDTDSDDDTVDDRTEIDFRSDPNDPGSRPSKWQFNLRGYWPLTHDQWTNSDPDPAQRYFQDASGRDFHGVLAGANTTSLGGINGPFGQRVPFLNGVDQRVEISGDPNEFNFPNGDFSVSAWFQISSWGKSWQAIVAKGEGDNWRVHRHADVAAGDVAYTGGEPDIFGGPNVADSRWHLVIATTGGIQKNLYIDGQLVASGARDPLGMNSQPMMIGGNPDTAGDNYRTILGAVTEVAVWGRELTAAEVRTIWNNYDGVSGGATIADLIADLDSDDDGLPDYWENTNGLDSNRPNAGEDPDGDGLTNAEEFELGTDPQDADMDDDGLTDKEELDLGTNVLDPDTDNDGVDDGDEVTGELNAYLDGVRRNPFNPNTDPPGDPTDPFVSDSDGDGRSDGVEITARTDPNDPVSFPQAPVVLYYNFDQANPTVVANLGTSRSSGTVVGGTTYTDSLRPELGKAFLGNRTGANNAYINTNLTGIQLGLAGQNYTASALVRWDGVAGGEDHMIFAQTRTDNALHHGIRANGGGVNDGHFGHWGNDINDAGTFVPGQWHHVAYSYQNGAATVHLDGVQVGTNNVGTLHATGAAEAIVIGYTGRDANAHGSFNGAIDEVKIYGRALSGIEILEEAARLLPPDPGPGGPRLVMGAGAYNRATQRLTFSVVDIPVAQTYHLRMSTDGQNFSPVVPNFDFDDLTLFPATLAIDPDLVPEAVLQIFSGPSVP